MAGLLSQQAPAGSPAQPAMPGEAEMRPGEGIPAEEPEAPSAGGQGVSREQMDKLEGAIATGMSIIAEGAVLQAVVQEAQKDPVDALANATVAVLQKIGEKDPVLACAIASFLIGIIADALEKVGLPPVSQQQLFQGLQAASFLWLKENEGSLDPGRMQQYMAEIQQIVGGAQ